MSTVEHEQLDGRMQSFAESGGEVVVIGSMKRSPGLHDIRAYREIKQVMARGFDIVHTHTSKAGTLGRLAARSGSAAVVHTPHGHIFHGYFGWFMTAAFITFERRLAAKCDVLVALTAAERDDHLALGIGRASQWRVIPSGVDVAALSLQVDAWRSANGDERIWDAVSVGRLTAIKGMERLVRAWAEVRQQHPDARLAIVGDGEERSRLEDMCSEMGLSSSVHFAGWSDPVPYLAGARTFVLLSHNEGMGRAVVEAFAAGLPCVVADVCGLRELVTPACGAVVDADDTPVVAEALLTLWGESVPVACRQRAQSYSLQKMLDDLLLLYSNLKPSRGEM